MIEFIQTIEGCSDKELSLPDGVAALDDGSFVVADSGNDRICLFDSDGNALKAIGGKGFGKHRFKEPVGVFVSPVQTVFVPDWHNHRVVIYDKSLKYLGEFGHYGKLDPNNSLADKMRAIFRFLRTLAYTGSYTTHHFASAGERRVGNKEFSLRLLLHGLVYWRRRNTSLASAVKMMFSTYDAIDKPNGVAFYQDRVVVSQKNSKCLSVYHRGEDSNAYVPVAHFFGPSNGERFGRLGNIVYDERGILYVCDERNSTIWQLNADFELVGALTCGQDSGVGSFLPFSCCPISGDLLAVCGGFNFQIIDLLGNEVVYCSENIGELHGVAYDENLDRLYLADRSNGAIHVCRVAVQPGKSMARYPGR
jgi:hypothetical protein